MLTVTGRMIWREFKDEDGREVRISSSLQTTILLRDTTASFARLIRRGECASSRSRVHARSDPSDGARRCWGGGGRWQAMGTTTDGVGNILTAVMAGSPDQCCVTVLFRPFVQVTGDRGL
jgi:hypothetical protein